MMDQFVVWSLRGVTYLCLRNDSSSAFLETIRRI